MAHTLAEQFAERISAGLKRKGVTKCSKWAEQYRVMGGKSFPGPWTFKYHPWSREMHDSKAELNIGQKSAQMGFTEVALNKVLFEIDINGTDCLYVLPAKTPDASDFSAARFDAALQLSPHIKNMFSDVKNVGHKRAGSANLYIRGSRSDSGLKSVPTGLIIMDEVDEMTQENVPLAKERASGQLQKQIWMISTPTIDDFGISKEFKNSSQNHFHFKCPSCSRFIELKFPESLVITGSELDDPELKNSHYICYECKAKIQQEIKHETLANGVWIPSFDGKDAIGWHVNQLYSATISPYEMARAYLLALIDLAAEQEFYKSKLGLPHIVDGARVTDGDIETARRSYRKDDARPGGIYTMGIDVGKYCHYEVCEWFLPPPGTPTVDISVLAKCRVVTFGKVKDFSELDKIMYDLQIKFAVIDAMPERRSALDFVNRHYGRAKMNFYGNGVTGKNIHVATQEPTITVDRTSWMDLALGRFRNHTIAVPADVDIEYRTHIQAPIRVYKKDKDGNPFGVYLKPANKEDHYAHARTYAEIALPLALSLNVSQDTGSPL